MRFLTIFDCAKDIETCLFIYIVVVFRGFDWIEYWTFSLNLKYLLKAYDEESLFQYYQGTIFHDRFSDSRMSKLIPSENVLNTFAVKCSFDIFTTNLGIGSHQFQVDLSTRNNSDQWVFNTSDWTSPIRYCKYFNFIWTLK